MGHGPSLDLLQPVEDDLDDGKDAAAPRSLASSFDCLEQLLEAFRDIADRDDIHQAAARLELVQEWIRDEARRAAADPIFTELRLVKTPATNLVRRAQNPAG
jgi:hypothetical protein